MENPQSQDKQHILCSFGSQKPQDKLDNILIKREIKTKHENMCNTAKAIFRIKLLAVYILYNTKDLKIMIMASKK